MSEQKECRGCPQENRCQEAYEKMGKSQAPSVALKVVIVFLLPMLVFIGSLLAAQKLLASVVKNEDHLTIISFFAAIAVTFVFLVVIRSVNKNLSGKNNKLGD